MAQNIDIALPAGGWVLLTNSDVTALRVELKQGIRVDLMATVGAVPPSSTSGSLVLERGAILSADIDLTATFTGVAGANRVYAFSGYGGLISVSHA